MDSHRKWHMKFFCFGKFLQTSIFLVFYLPHQFILKQRDSERILHQIFIRKKLQILMYLWRRMQNICNKLKLKDSNHPLKDLLYQETVQNMTPGPNQNLLFRKTSFVLYTFKFPVNDLPLMPLLNVLLCL